MGEDCRIGESRGRIYGIVKPPVGGLQGSRNVWLSKAELFKRSPDVKTAEAKSGTMGWEQGSTKMTEGIRKAINAGKIKM